MGKIRSFITKGILHSISFFNFFIISIVVMGLEGHLFSEKITNQRQLEKVLREEMSKLKMNENISAKFGKALGEVAHVRKISENNYEIVLDYGKDRYAVKHELYHVYKNHFSQKMFVKQFFYCEPRAVIYGALGIK